jgi:glycosyltransferase involved in cell wall biosynthesis
MKILFLCKCSPLNEGGAETRSKEVAIHLARLGQQVTVLCAKTAVGEPEVQDFNGIKIICKKVMPDRLLRRFPYPHYFTLAASSLFLMIHIHRLVREEEFDLVREDVSPFPPSGLLSLRRLRARKRIAVAHNLFGTWKEWKRFYGPIYGTAGFLMDRLLRSGSLKYDRIICAAKWLKEELEQCPKIAKKVRYVPNGVNLDDFSFNRARRSKNGHIRLLSVGRLVEAKGHSSVIEALSYLKAEFPSLKLDILGSGPLKQSLSQLAARLDITDSISFRSSVTHKEMPLIYQGYDIFVMASVTEGFPVALLEAMACGLPIIASDIPANTGVLDRASAVFFESGDARDLAHKLKWAIANRDCLAENAARAHILAEGYDWRVIAEKETLRDYEND